MAVGVTTPYLSQTAISDGVVVNRDGSTMVQATRNLALQLLADPAFASSAFATIAVFRSSLAALTIVAPAIGTHGAVLTNDETAGIYEYTGGGWVRRAPIPAILTESLAAIEAREARDQVMAALETIGSLAQLETLLEAVRRDADRTETAAASVNLQRVANAPSLKALDTAQWRGAVLSDGIYLWAAGDFSIPYAAEGGADFFLIKADDVPVSAGCWVRLAMAPDPADFHTFRAREDLAANFRVEALNGAVNLWTAMGGTPTSGGGSYPPVFKTEGPGDNVPGALVAKGDGGFVFGNALGKLFEALSGVAGYITDRIIKIRPGTTGQSYASIDAEAGLDLKAGGDTVLRILDGAGAGTAHVEIIPGGANYVQISMPAGKGLVLAADGGLQLQNISNTDYKWQAHNVSTGGTVNLSQFMGVHLINPDANPLATLTINFPVSPVDGSIVKISPRAAVTAVTWVSPGGYNIMGAPAGLSRTEPLSFIFFTGFGWQRIT